MGWYPQVRLARSQGQANDATFKGIANIALEQRQPEYQISGKLIGLPWRSGAMMPKGRSPLPAPTRIS